MPVEVDRFINGRDLPGKREGRRTGALRNLEQETGGAGRA
jgi:hypothetical protein